MEAKQAHAQHPHAAEDDGEGEREGHDIRIGLDHVKQAVELARRFPIPFGSVTPRRARQKKAGERKKGQTGAAELQQALRPGIVGHREGVIQLECEQADPVHADREQVTQVKRDGEQGGHRIACRPGPLTQGDPGGRAPQGKTDAEEVVQDADQEDVVVQQGKREQRQHRPAPEQRAVQRKRARHDQREDRHGEDLARQVDVHHPRDPGDDQVHHQVGQHLPIDLVVLAEEGVLAVVGHDLHARNVVRVILERRQGVGQQRNDRDQQENGEDDHRLHGASLATRRHRLCRRAVP